MSNDLQSTLTLQLGQAVAALRQTQTELGQTTAQVKKLVREKETLQTKTTTTMRAMQMEAKETQKHYRDLGQSMGKMGGPAGELASRLGGAMGMAGGFSAVAGAATIAGLALRGFSNYSRQMVENANRSIDVFNKLNEAQRGGEKTKAQNAASTLSSHADSARRLITVAGPEATEKAAAISQAQGIPMGEAMDLMAVSHANFPSRDPAEVIGIANKAASTGMISRSDALKRMIDNPLYQRMLKNVKTRFISGALKKELSSRIIAQEYNALTGHEKRGDVGWQTIIKNLFMPDQDSRPNILKQSDYVNRIDARASIADFRNAEAAGAIPARMENLYEREDPSGYAVEQRRKELQREADTALEKAERGNWWDSATETGASMLRKAGMGSGSRFDEAQDLSKAVEKGVERALNKGIKLNNATGGN